MRLTSSSHQIDRTGEDAQSQRMIEKRPVGKGQMCVVSAACSLREDSNVATVDVYVDISSVDNGYFYPPHLDDPRIHLRRDCLEASMDYSV